MKQKYLISEKLEVSLQEFCLQVLKFKTKSFFFKNFEFNNRCKNAMKDNNKKYAINLRIHFPKKRFYGLWFH